MREENSSNCSTPSLLSSTLDRLLKGQFSLHSAQFCLMAHARAIAHPAHSTYRRIMCICVIMRENWSRRTLFWPPRPQNSLIISHAHTPQQIYLSHPSQHVHLVILLEKHINAVFFHLQKLCMAQRDDRIWERERIHGYRRAEHAEKEETKPQLIIDAHVFLSRYSSLWSTLSQQPFSWLMHAYVGLTQVCASVCRVNPVVAPLHANTCRPTRVHFSGVITDHFLWAWWFCVDLFLLCLVHCHANIQKHILVHSEIIFPSLLGAKQSSHKIRHISGSKTLVVPVLTWQIVHPHC